MRTWHQAERRHTRVIRQDLTHCTVHTHSHIISPQQPCVLHSNTHTHTPQWFTCLPGRAVTFVWKGEVCQWSKQQNKTTFSSMFSFPSSTASLSYRSVIIITLRHCRCPHIKQHCDHHHHPHHYHYPPHYHHHYSRHHHNSCHNLIQ